MSVKVLRSALSSINGFVTPERQIESLLGKRSLFKRNAFVMCTSVNVPRFFNRSRMVLEMLSFVAVSIID